MHRSVLGFVFGALFWGTPAVLAGDEATPPSTVIVIIVDTLRIDRLAAWDSERPVMPRLDEWLERAVVFEQARASSPWTLPSCASMYTGLYPVRHGARSTNAAVGRRRSFNGIRPDVPVLAEIFSQQGWETVAFVANRFLGSGLGFARGFDTYVQFWNWKETEPRAPSSVDAALDWLDTRTDQRVFLVLHVIDPHLPYDPPPETRGRFSGDYTGDLRFPIKALRKIRSGERAPSADDRRFVEAAYDEDTAFADLHVGRFLDDLEDRGILDRALVIFTSDHGEEFWDHGGFEHGHTLFDELLRVPLAVWSPGVEPRRVTTPVTLTDLTPTILDAVGIRAPGDLDGVSLWPVISRRQAPPTRTLLAESTLDSAEQRAVIAWPWKLVEFPDEDRRELYNLADDPGERTDVSLDQPEVVSRLAAFAAESFTIGDDVISSEVELDEETLEALRSLGYLD